MAKPDGKGRWIIGESETVTISRRELRDLKIMLEGYKTRCDNLEHENAELTQAVDALTAPAPPPAAETPPAEPAPPPSAGVASVGAEVAGAVNGMLGTLRTTGAMAVEPQPSEAPAA